jgi:hypothetical protein
MVSAADVRRHMAQRPFRPFRIHLRDGRRLDVPDPTWALVGEPILLVGVAQQDAPISTVPDGRELVDYPLIDRIEALPVLPVGQQES